MDRGRQIFRDQVRPAFEGFAGCHGIEMYVGVEETAGGFVDIAAVSRWDSLEAIEQATHQPEYDQALAELRDLFEKTPIVRHFEAVD